MGNGFTLSVAEGEWVYPERSRRGMGRVVFVNPVLKVTNFPSIIKRNPIRSRQYRVRNGGSKSLIAILAIILGIPLAIL